MNVNSQYVRAAEAAEIDCQLCGNRLSGSPDRGKLPPGFASGAAKPNDATTTMDPDPSSLLVELEHLERREREVSALRRKLHDRLDSFPNEVTLLREREVSAERRDLHLRIDQVRAKLQLP